MTEKPVQIIFRGSPDLKKRLRQEALDHGTTIQDIIERAIGVYLANPVPNTDLQDFTNGSLSDKLLSAKLKAAAELAAKLHGLLSGGSNEKTEGKSDRDADRGGTEAAAEELRKAEEEVKKRRNNVRERKKNSGIDAENKVVGKKS